MTSSEHYELGVSSVDAASHVNLNQGGVESIRMDDGKSKITRAVIEGVTTSARSEARSQINAYRKKYDFNVAILGADNEEALVSLIVEPIIMDFLRRTLTRGQLDLDPEILTVMVSDRLEAILRLHGVLKAG